MSLTRLLAAWASTRPSAARPNNSGLKPGARTASRPAIAAEVSVIGWTHARVRTSQRLTMSEAPGGALQVDITTRHASSGLLTRAVSAVAIGSQSVGLARDVRPDRVRHPA